MANTTPRPPFMPSIVEMRPGEDYDRYLWRRRKVWEREKADWLRAGNMGQARDSDGNPLYRINDRGQWARTRRMSSRTRRAVLERDGRKCVECGSAKFLEIDHVVRYIDGGSDDLENLRVLCESCHRKRGGRA